MSYKKSEDEGCQQESTPVRKGPMEQFSLTPGANGSSRHNVHSILPTGKSAVADIDPFDVTRDLDDVIETPGVNWDGESPLDGRVLQTSAFVPTLRAAVCLRGLAALEVEARVGGDDNLGRVEDDS
ncbi:unnamed protein product [Cyprideis torosa]|uniref:Uncharacterized protein n=1 Tax=Cyprideis torosa TaxID=163714 RepID=A0A7R8ZN54_9CRUS|nr:unnamed protein product [Cyprideis torosa]CAG0885828.1 unnamed protein product [Cyprideis torosa]